MRVKCEWLICRWRERGTDWLLYVHTHYKNYFLRPELNAYQTMEETSGREQSNRSCFCFLKCSGALRTGVNQTTLGDRGDHYIPCKWLLRLTDWKEHVSNMPHYASDTFEKLPVKRETVMKHFLCSWNLSDLYTAESLPSVILYLLIFVMVYRFLCTFLGKYIFTLIYSLIFFFFNSDLPHIPAANKSGVRVQNVSRK